MAQLEFTTRNRTVIQQPRREGGMGFQMVGGMEAEAGIIKGHLAKQAFLGKYYPDMYQQSINTYNNADLILGTANNAVEWTGIDTITRDSMTAATVGRVMALGKKKAYKKIGEELVNQVAENDDTRQYAAFLLSAKGSMASSTFIDSTAGIDSSVYFSNAAYIQCMRRVLGAPLTNNEPLVRVCSCREAFERGKDNAHGLGCSNNRDEHIKLHNGVSENLHIVMKELFPNDLIEREQQVGQIVTPNHDGGPPHIKYARGDITWMRGGVEKIIIDVSVVHPEGKMYIKNPILSHLNQDAAALAVENRKRLHYQKVSVPAAIPGSSVIPFVLESTGRLGPSAFSFLNSLCLTQTYRRSKFINDCAMLCARYCGFMLVNTRERFAATSYAER